MTEKRGALIPLLFVALAPGCAAPRDLQAVHAYYRGDFTEARERWREPAFGPVDENTILYQARLGMAAMADGDLDEAELALLRAFEWLSTAGLNADRTTGAVLLHEGVRVWKGEPFEQALIYAETAALYAELGDWESVRAAAANALFRLTDFGADEAEAGNDPDVETAAEYTAVDTNFALGFLLQATGSRLSDGAAAEAQFDAALAINESLEPIATALRTDFNTLLIVDFGKGPTKQSYGPDDALVRFVPQDEYDGPIVIERHFADPDRIGWESFAEFPAACDVNAMARDLRWTNLEDARRAKSFIGKGLMVGGIATAIGSDKGEHQAIGVGLAVLGGLLRLGASADTRYLETVPQLVYVVPLTLDEPTTLRVRADGAEVVLEDLEPGMPSAPRSLYVRLLR